MNKDKVIKSRYGEPRTLRRVNEDTYTLTGVSRYHRCGSNIENTGLAFIDLEGGPFIHINEPVSFYGADGDDRTITKVELAETEVPNTVTVKITVA